MAAVQAFSANTEMSQDTMKNIGIIEVNGLKYHVTLYQVDDLGNLLSISAKKTADHARDLLELYARDLQTKERVNFNGISTIKLEAPEMPLAIEMLESETKEQVDTFDMTIETVGMLWEKATSLVDGEVQTEDDASSTGYFSTHEEEEEDLLPPNTPPETTPLSQSDESTSQAKSEGSPESDRPSIQRERPIPTKVEAATITSAEAGIPRDGVSLEAILHREDAAHEEETDSVYTYDEDSEEEYIPRAGVSVNAHLIFSPLPHQPLSIIPFQPMRTISSIEEESSTPSIEASELPETMPISPQEDTSEAAQRTYQWIKLFIASEEKPEYDTPPTFKPGYDEGIARYAANNFEKVCGVCDGRSYEDPITPPTSALNGEYMNAFAFIEAVKCSRFGITLLQKLEAGILLEEASDEKRFIKHLHGFQIRWLGYFDVSEEELAFAALRYSNKTKRIQALEQLVALRTATTT